MKLMNLAGQKFSRLRVDGHSRRENRKTKWLCVCDCGNIKWIRSDSIKSSEYFGDAGNARRWFTYYKSDAKRRNRQFDLTFEQFKTITSRPCSYCGYEGNLFSDLHASRIAQPFQCNGIDRVDNSIGYILENVVSCCKMCNFMKHKLTREEFLKQVRKIFKWVER